MRADAKRLRREMSEPERRLWHRPRAHRLQGVQFRRQQPIGPDIADFYCSARKLVIEVDGSQHAADVAHARDEVRAAWLRSNGHGIVRYWTSDIIQRLGDVLADLEIRIRP
jgi:very-short-patch-repair endonuclease